MPSAPPSYSLSSIFLPRHRWFISDNPFLFFWALIPPDNIFALIFHQWVMRFILVERFRYFIQLHIDGRAFTDGLWVNYTHYITDLLQIRTHMLLCYSCIKTRIRCMNMNTVRQKGGYLWAYLIVTDFPQGRTFKKHPQEESWDVRKTFSGSIRRGESVCSGTEAFPVGIRLHFY